MMDQILSRLRQEKRPFFQEGFFYLPQDGREHFPESFSFLPEGKAIAIEYCSGNGQWILEKAEKNPSLFWIAVEKKWQRACKIWSKMSKMKLENIFVVYGEAFAFTRCFLSSQSVEEVFVNFPDPWPKRRHCKHRLIQKKFIDELSRVVKMGGSVTLVTDDPVYCEVMRQEMCSAKTFQSKFPEPCYITHWPEYGSSFFEDLWRKKGLDIRYLQFLRKLS